MNKSTYDLDVAYDRGRMLGDALVHYAHLCLNERTSEDQMEKRLVAVFRSEATSSNATKKPTIRKLDNETKKEV